ncbi:type II secretion system F family protein [Aureliella helgolandensis]|uniref:Type IV pilin biogenesis protein n=1 Tax=Aureliella helgolandensis TaxID=2527968 RepID=A0A518GHV1_9BACT|nr:hypothetical protein [Aureliella helgolandensis]QDV28110.1 hypothetical protein Q31a_65050 [Aureliella helgolandensis]
MTYLLSNWLILVPLAISLFIAIQVAQAHRDTSDDSLLMLLLRCIMSLMLLAGFLSLGTRISILSILWLLMLSGLSVVLVVKLRRLARSALFHSCLNAAATRQMPQLLFHFAAENRGWLRRRSVCLQRLLAQGREWDDALQQQEVAKGMYDCLAVRLQKRYGPSTQIRLGEQPRSGPQPKRIESQIEALLGRLMLGSWFVLTIPLSLFIILAIVPTLAQMFEEFGLQLPSIFRNLLACYDLVTEPPWVFLAILVVLLLMACYCLGILLWIFPRLLQSQPFRYLCADYFRSVSLTALMHAADREPTLLEACRAAEQLVPAPFLQWPFQRAVSALENGCQLSEAFHLSGLVTSAEQKQLPISLDEGDPTWSLQQFSIERIDRMVRRYSFWFQWLVVLQTLLFAVLVGWLAVGTIQVLSELISFQA